MNSVERGFVYYFLIFGIIEFVSNLFHLSKKTNSKRSESSRKQHQEIPPDLSSTHYIVKAMIMFLFGALFLLSGILMQLNGKFIPGLFYGSLLLFALYSLIQAVIYRKYWKVWSALLVYNLPLIIFLILH